jgi:hypothetical protein
MSTRTQIAFLPGLGGLMAAATLLAACGAATATADQACGDVAQARCGKRMTCTNGVGITRIWGDLATCLGREKLACTIGLSAPSTGNSPALVEKCVVAMAGESCSDFLDNNPPDDCVIVGVRANGAACAFAGQCATSFCNGNKISACGTCAEMPAASSSCATAACGRRQDCVASTQLCQDLGLIGVPCNSHFPCGADLSCDGATNTAMGTCVAAVATVGAACDGITTPGCDGTMGLRCSGTPPSLTCAATTLVGANMPCGLLPNGFVGCAGAGTCYTATGVAGSVEMGTCKTPAADNGACDTVLGPGCLPPARCVPTAAGSAGTCIVPSGASCG